MTDLIKENWDENVEAFARLNGWVETRRYGGVYGVLAKLADIRGTSHRRPGDVVEHVLRNCRRRLIDHDVCFRIGRTPVALLTEPYGDEDWIDAARDIFAACPVRVSIPPNPYASLWYPGSTLCMVITREDSPPVRWLDAQLAFAGRPPGVLAGLAATHEGVS